MSWPSSRTRQVGRKGPRVSEENLTTIRELLARCSPEEQAALFRELRARHLIHEFEEVIGAPAEMILEAVHRAPELTRRMLRGVIADAAFRQFAVRSLAQSGWRDVTPAGTSRMTTSWTTARSDHRTGQAPAQRARRARRETRRAIRLRRNRPHCRNTEDPLRH